jgi:hypothetical protein
VGRHRRHVPLTSPGMRSTSDTSTPPRGCLSTAPATDCARSMTTSRGTSSCARMRSFRGARHVCRSHAGSEDEAMTGAPDVRTRPVLLRSERQR